MHKPRRRRSRYGSVLLKIQKIYWITGSLLAKRVGIPYGTYANYAYSGFIPDETTHAKIVRFLKKVGVTRIAVTALNEAWRKEHISRPVLDVPYDPRVHTRTHPPRRVIRTKFGSLLRQILYSYNISISDFVDISKIPRGTLGNWIYMGQYPLPDQFSYLMKTLKRMGVGRTSLNSLDRAWLPARIYPYRKR